MRRLEALVAVAVLSAPLGAAWIGTRGPLTVAFNLGPGDAPYLEGFLPSYEIDEKVATHWTSYEARIALPLHVEGGPVEVDYRYARVFPQTAEIEVDVGGAPVDRFSRRGGVYEERHGRLAAMDGPLTFDVRADSHERQDMGIKLDWVRFDLGEAASVRLIGGPFWEPFVLGVVVVVLIVAAGVAPVRAVIWSAPAILALSFSLLVDPWLTHRLLRGLIVALSLFGVAGLAGGRLLRIDPRTLRAVFGFMLVAFVLRAVLVNLPDFYYPDLRTHARLVGFVRDAGLQFLVSPSVVIAEHNVWVTGAFGKTYAFPYTPMFHVPFAIFDLDYDTLVLALKLGGAAVSTLPIALVWAFAARMGRGRELALVAASLMVVIPTYASRLSFAFLPSLFGHTVDLVFLFWVFGNLSFLTEGRRWLIGGLLVAASYLAYVSGVLNIGIFIVVLAATVWLFAGTNQRPLALRVLGMGVLGGLIAFAVFYRDFLPMVLDLLSRTLGSGEAVESRYPITGFFETAGKRTFEFFGFWYPALTAVGLAILYRRGTARLVFGAWLVTYVLLLLGRAKIPDIFLHGHETLFLTPLVCIASAVVIAALLGHGGVKRLAGALILVSLTVLGLWRQWGYFADQMRNAL